MNRSGLRTDADTTRPPLPHRGRAVALGIALPLALIIATYALVIAWLPDLPDPVALHWGTRGVDRIGPVTELLTVGSVLIGFTAVVFFPMVLLLGRSALTRRMTVGLSVGLTTLFCGILLTQIATQRGITDARDATDPGLGIALTMTAALVLGAAAALLTGADPARPASGPVPADADRLELADGARAVWSGKAATRRPWLLVVVGLVPVTVAAVIGVATGQWWLLLPMALLGLLLIGFLSFTVHVDRGGLTARSNLGIRVLHVPADEVIAASVAQVDPFAEFGGWGLRTNVHGTTGLVTRAGEAIRIERTGGRVVVLTLDDAATAAALLNTMADRARARERSE